MILYLDTSALIKLYIDEEHSAQVADAFKKADAHVCHVIGYVEFYAAIARLHRENVVADEDYAQLKNAFSSGWAHYVRIPATQRLLDRAAELAGAFSLRACDSVHLAAADLAAKQSGEATIFACYDMALNRAAHVLGLALLADEAT